MAEVDEWTADSNQALELSFVVPSGKGAGLSKLARFHPKFTYPIFGDDERIFGYQGLKISLRFHASDMRPNLDVHYGRKFKSIGDTEPTDVEAVMREFLPPVAFAKGRDFETAIRSLPADWTPPGEVLTVFEAKDGGSFEIRRGYLADPAIKQLHARIQILVPLFIEGGVVINTDGELLDRWEVFFLYYKKPASSTTDAPPYQFAGYTTVYKFFPLQRHAIVSSVASRDSFDLPKEEFPTSALQSRNRISQFVILSPFQGAGNGARLYSSVYKHYLADPNILEVTVEDPNEAFDDMRDVTDLAFLRTTPEFNALHLNADIVVPKKGAAPHNVVDEDKMESTRLKYKIAPRQFSRVLEMHLMSKLAESVQPSLSERKTRAAPSRAEVNLYNLWKLFVKSRLYRHNKELLGQLDRAERIDKLNETLGSVELEYARLIALSARRNSTEADGSKGKRKLEGEDDVPSASKKARVEDE